MPKMHEYMFGGWAPHGPAGGACAIPQTRSRNLGGLLLRASIPIIK